MARPGPAFWDARYSIGTYEEFFSRIEAWMPASVGYVIQIKDDQWARLAYDNPFSAPGTWAALVLETAKLTGNDEPATSDASRRGLAAAQQAGEAGMAPLVIPNVYRVAIHATSGGQDVINVVGVRGTAQGQQLAAAQAVQSAWKTAAGPLAKISSLVQLVKFRAMDLSSVDGGIAEVADATVGGQITNTLATAGACALVKWNGGTRSGSSRGRLYYGPIREADINADGRTMVAGSRTDVQAAFGFFRTVLDQQGFPLVVISRKTASAAAVSSHSVETIIATQRRRIRD